MTTQPSIDPGALRLAGGADDDRMPERIGRRRFIRSVGAVAGATALTSVVPTGSAGAVVPAGASSYRPLATAVRLVDTRRPAGYTFTRLSANHIRVQVAGDNGVPAAASALVLTVTGVNWSLPNFVTVFPTGSSVPTVSNLNLVRANEISANLVTVKTGDGGHVDVFSRVPCDVIVDVLGYYQPETGAVREGRFVGLATAQRAIDTRPNLVGKGSITVVDVSRWVPADASSVVINLTATQCTGPGYFTAFAYTSDSVPGTSSLNVVDVGATRASAVIVPVSNVGGKRRIKVFTLTPAKLIVDVNGYFTGPDSSLAQVGLFVPMAPQRILDTRDPGQIGRLWPGWVVEAVVPGEAGINASAIVGNVTAVNTRNAGYLTVSAARLPIPGTSNVNFVSAGAVVPNHVVTPVTAAHGFQVYSSHGAHVLFDLAGYFTGVPKIPKVAKYVNPPPPSVPPPWVLRIPRFGLTSTVLDGDARYITDTGRTWHWSGTGVMGQEAHVAVFGHRTEAGGPYRHIDWMVPGDLFTVTTNDGREYLYRMVRRDLTDAQNANILAATRFHPGATFSMVACTVGYDSSKSRYPDKWAPTSLKYRIVVTGELVSWREI